MGLKKILIISLTFRELPKPAALCFSANAYKPVCKVNRFFVWWRNCKAHGWDHRLIPSGANDLPFGPVRVVRQNTFVVFINGYLVLNEEQNKQMMSLLNISFPYPILGFWGLFEGVENFTSEQYDLISKIYGSCQKLVCF